MQHQTDLRYTFETSGNARFDVVSFTLKEALSQPFELNVELSSSTADIDFSHVMDRPALFTLWRGDEPVRRVHGLVSLFSQGSTGFRRTRYRAVLEPTLARSALTTNWRIFQQQTVPQIIDQVLKEQGLEAVDQRLGEPHQTREYCVQAGETDLAFLGRLAAEEGLVYRFEHSEHQHRLIYVDHINQFPAIPGSGASEVIYNPQPGGVRFEPGLERFAYTEQVRTTCQVLRDYTFKNPRYAQQHEACVPSGNAVGYVNFDYPGRYKRDEAGKPFTRTRLAALRRDAAMATVEGDDARLQPGLAFNLTGHPRDDYNRRWRAVSVEHTGTQYTSQEEDSADSPLGTTYRQTAQLVASDSHWKAELQPKPRIDGSQVATVVGPPGEQIYCDEWGRIKVSFPWDRDSKNDEHSSCWIRVSQGWAGTTFGCMAVPRVGQEVIVDYLDGDADQPIVVGRTYRAANLPPYPLPKHKTRMTIKSQTHKGVGFNELRFEDEKDQEEIYVHAQKDQNIHVNHDESTFIGHDRSHTVEHDESISIGNDRQLSISGNSRCQVTGEQQHQVKGGRKTEVLADDSLHVSGRRTLTVGGGLALSSARQVHLQAGDQIILDAGASLTLQAGGHCITLDPSGIRSSVPIDIGAVPSVIPPVVNPALSPLPIPPGAPPQPLTPSLYVQAAQNAALLTQPLCELDAHDDCPVHPHH